MNPAAPAAAGDADPCRGAGTILGEFFSYKSLVADKGVLQKGVLTVKRSSNLWCRAKGSFKKVVLTKRKNNNNSKNVANISVTNKGRTVNYFLRWGGGNHAEIDPQLSNGIG